MYHPFPLKCFDALKEQTLKHMQNFNTNRFYIENIPISDDLREIFNSEMSEYGLGSAWNFLCFKRKYYIFETSMVHIDYSFEINNCVYVSIILPLEGCEDTHMYWMNGDYELEHKITSANSDYSSLIWKGNSEVVDRVEISKEPMMIRADVPHSVTSRKDGSYRTVLTVRLLGNPTFEEILQKRFDNKS